MSANERRKNKKEKQENMTTKEKLSFPEIGLIVGVPGAIGMTTEVVRWQ